MVIAVSLPVVFFALLARPGQMPFRHTAAKPGKGLITSKYYHFSILLSRWVTKQQENRTEMYFFRPSPLPAQ
jgi:hypothetical protein